MTHGDVESQNPVPVRISQALAVAQWMANSTLMIYANKWILKSFNFRHPVYLTFAQTLGISAALAVHARFAGRSGTADLLDRDTYLRYVLPVAAMFTASIVLRNYVYLYLSVAAMQLLASAAPVIVFLVTCATGHERMTPPLALAVGIVCFGVGLSSTCEVKIAWQGVLMQVAAMVLEGFRAVRLKTFIKASGASLDSLKILQLLSPVSAALLYVPAALVDFEDIWKYTQAAGWAVHAALICNVAVAFCLNLSALRMLREVSVLTTSLSGVFKDCVIIWTSLALGDGRLTATTALGWLASAVGLCWYARMRSTA